MAGMPSGISPQLHPLLTAGADVDVDFEQAGVQRTRLASIRSGLSSSGPTDSKVSG